jgi:hypothetical protein
MSRREEWEGRLVVVGRKAEEVGKQDRRANIVQILCTQVCKWKNYTC